MVEYEFKTTPFAHQQKEFEEHYDDPYRAILWEQGTGKTKLTIDSASKLFLEGKINGLLVLAPGGVHLNWEKDEIPTHMPDGVLAKALCVSYKGNKAGTKWHKRELQRVLSHKGFSIVCMSYDSFMTSAGSEFVKDFLWKRETMYVLDESSRVKNWTAKRTQRVVASGPFSTYRRILNGTPVTKGPFDLYGQLKFLQASFWRAHGLDVYPVFRKFFGVFKKQVRPGVVDRKGNPKFFDQLVSYRNLEMMNKILAGVSSRVTKEEVLDLPEKLYTKRYFELTPEQDRMYQQMASEYIALFESEADCPVCAGGGWIQYEEVDAPCPHCEGSGKGSGEMVTAQLAITRLLRFQQITCGYLPVEMDDPEDTKVLKPIPGGNPRIELFKEIVEELEGSFIVFARFTRDIELIMEVLNELGIEAVRYDGSVKEEQRHENKVAFQERRARAFVAYTPVAAEGLTLHAAKTVIYYSNDFSLHNRLQSEDRAHRIGQTENVLYIDICAANTVDVKILDNLKQKFDIAVKITGDKLKEWLKL